MNEGLARGSTPQLERSFDERAGLGVAPLIPQHHAQHVEGADQRRARELVDLSLRQGFMENKPPKPWADATLKALDEIYYSDVQRAALPIEPLPPR